MRARFGGAASAPSVRFIATTSGTDAPSGRGPAKPQPQRPEQSSRKRLNPRLSLYPSFFSFSVRPRLRSVAPSLFLRLFRSFSFSIRVRLSLSLSVSLSLCLSVSLSLSLSLSLSVSLSLCLCLSLSLSFSLLSVSLWRLCRSSSAKVDVAAMSALAVPHVPQRAEWDCGIACAAMALGCAQSARASSCRPPPPHMPTDPAPRAREAPCAAKLFVAAAGCRMKRCSSGATARACGRLTWRTSCTGPVQRQSTTRPTLARGPSTLRSASTATTLTPTNCASTSASPPRPHTACASSSGASDRARTARC